MAWTPNIAFVTGSYPGQVIPSSDINLLLDNGTELVKRGLSVNTTSTSSINQATTGTWTTIGSFSDAFGNGLVANKPYLLQAFFNVGVSAVVANRILFSFADGSLNILDGVHFKMNTDTLSRRSFVINKWINPPTSTIYIRWQLENATAVIATLVDGYRLVAVPI